MKFTGIILGIAILLTLIIISFNIIEHHKETDNKVINGMKNYWKEVLLIIGLISLLVGIIVLSSNNPSGETSRGSY